MIIKESEKPKSVTILIRGGSKTIRDETQRCLHDAICVVRNLLKNQNVVVGGGACELNSAIKIRKQAEDITDIDQFMIKAFAEALEQIPMTLAENSGMNPIQAVSEARIQQKETNSSEYGISCVTNTIENLKEQKVFESLESKIQQIQLST